MSDVGGKHEQLEQHEHQIPTSKIEESLKRGIQVGAGLLN
jgi:hypothetical protein